MIQVMSDSVDKPMAVRTRPEPASAAGHDAANPGDSATLIADATAAGFHATAYAATAGYHVTTTSDAQQRRRGAALPRR